MGTGEKLGAPMTQNQQTEGIKVSEGSKVFFEIAIATIPAVVLYFIGWVYLNFYISAFGITVSELDLDIQTIFIY
jgi:hypothetical protein